MIAFHHLYYYAAKIGITLLILGFFALKFYAQILRTVYRETYCVDMVIFYKLFSRYILKV